MGDMARRPAGALSGLALAAARTAIMMVAPGLKNSVGFPGRAAPILAGRDADLGEVREGFWGGPQCLAGEVEEGA